MALRGTKDWESFMEEVGKKISESKAHPKFELKVGQDHATISFASGLSRIQKNQLAGLFEKTRQKHGLLLSEERGESEQSGRKRLKVSTGLNYEIGKKEARMHYYF